MIIIAYCFPSAAVVVATTTSSAAEKIKGGSKGERISEWQ
jgi:hypothetical protein